jgi:hypothetical protein
MKRLLVTLVVAAGAVALLPSAASAAPVCTSVNKGGTTADRKLVVSSCRDWTGVADHREYAVLYIGRTSTAAGSCMVSLNTVEIDEAWVARWWTPGLEIPCNDALRRNLSLRYWGDAEYGHFTFMARTVACLFLNGRKVGGCVYSPVMWYPS